MPSYIQAVLVANDSDFGIAFSAIIIPCMSSAIPPLAAINLGSSFTGEMQQSVKSGIHGAPPDSLPRPGWLPGSGAVCVGIREDRALACSRGNNEPVIPSSTGIYI